MVMKDKIEEEEKRGRTRREKKKKGTAQNERRVTSRVVPLVVSSPTVSAPLQGRFGPFV